MSNGTQRAAIYVRVSTASQEDGGTSLGTQEDRCRQYAASRGYDVTLFFRETHTGVELWERPQLTALRDAVRHDQIDVVVAYAIDRLSRDPVHLGVVLSEADHHGARVEFVSEPLDESPEGQLIRFVRGYAAKVEHTKLVERAMRGRRARVTSGKPLASGRPLYGYRWETPAHERLAIDPITSPIVQRIFMQAVSGTSLRSIASSLTNDGIPTPTGKRSYWNPNTVGYILHHPSYTGQAYGWCWRPGGTTRAPSFDPVNAIKLPDGTVPALIDQAIWDAVQERLAKNKQQASRNNRTPAHALLRGGIAVCGYCDGALHVKYVAKTGDIYVCGHASPSRGGCRFRGGIKVEILDSAVWGRVSAILTQPDIVEQELARLAEDDPTTADLAAIDRSLAEIDRQRTNLTRALSVFDNPDDADTVVAHLASLADRRRQLTADRDAIASRRDGWERAQAQMRDVVAWCRQVAARLDTLTYEQRRLALDALSVKAQVFRNNHEPRYIITASIPLGTDDGIVSSNP